uniref:Uncharacterized protein n=1 Tax=Populus trichocarpa TaxID=3694 RepID=A0A2K1YXF6_POPTR
MAMLLNKSSKMGSPLLHEFKRQASFLKEKIKTARLALTDVTPTELTKRSQMEIFGLRIHVPWVLFHGLPSKLMITGELWTFYTRGKIAVSYKTLLLLEHLLITHGPLRVAEEFQCDKDVIKEMGFGSFSQRSSSADESLKASDFRTWLTCNSNYSHQHNHAEDDEFMDSNEKLLFEETIQIHEDTSQPVLGNPVKISREEYTAEDHPFCDNLHHTTVSLLSASE